MSFLAFNVGLETSSSSLKQFSPLAFQRSENETCHYLKDAFLEIFPLFVGYVIERNKRRQESARPDMIRKIRARLRLGRRRFQQPEERVQRLLTEISVWKLTTFCCYAFRLQRRNS
ncbi:hypothetical protein CEXT_499781 [Caerostris extrusa]|uniref:Maturase K n=1 Tax=Caerostris extrusa TaxID=172846 RepID=A0AAV4MV14_CAEEX|nr:hypothetical protein CEXT_499781 [Caerostris extrusa]